MFKFIGYFFNNESSKIDSSAALNDAKAQRISMKNNLPEIKPHQKNISNKSVSFHPKLNVVLIPTSAEFKAAGCDLWFSDEDFDQFKEEFHDDVKAYKQEQEELGNILTRGQASKEIYKIDAQNDAGDLPEVAHLKI